MQALARLLQNYMSHAPKCLFHLVFISYRTLDQVFSLSPAGGLCLFCLPLSMYPQDPRS